MKNTTLKNIKNLASALVQDESGQSTTEYVLLLLFVVMAVKAVGGTMKTKLQSLVDTVFSKAESEAGNP
jgi:Flp pilus assembly pilin Flp